MAIVPRQIDPSTEGPPDTSVAALTELPSESAFKAGIIHTGIKRSVAWMMIVTFLVLIFGVPVFQAMEELRLSGRVQATEILRNRPTRENLAVFEQSLERASVPRRWAQPWMQAAMTGKLRFGNLRTVVAPDGWLFYGPTIEYVSGPGFLDEQVLLQRRLAAQDDRRPEPFPDPRPAILQFHRDLATRGIRLVVLPMPTKASLQPHELAGRRFPLAQPTGVPNNPDFQRFLDDLRTAGVDVFDPTPPILTPGEAPRFLKQDSHWTPQWMEQVAGALARHLSATAGLGPATGSPLWHTQTMQVDQVGDLARLLLLPADQTLYPPQSVTIHCVRDSNDSPLQPKPGADVLLLGDSFCNIYSTPEMGYGAAAGFPEHLSRTLGREIDVITMNDNGAYATRQMLESSLARGDDRLAGTKVLVWEFVASELSRGDWKPIGLPSSNPVMRARKFIVPPPGEEWTVTGVVAARSTVADPLAVPYTDQVMAVHLVKLEGDHSVAGGEALVYLLAMQNKRLTDAATLQAGETVRLKLRNWNDVARKFGRMSRSELDDVSLLAQEPCWGERTVGK